MNISDLVLRLEQEDPTLTVIDLYDTSMNDSGMEKLLQQLLAHPNIVTQLHLEWNELTDETGIKLAHYVATSNTILYLDVSNNYFSEATYIAMAKALVTNTSLIGLYIDNNRLVSDEIESSFVNALMLNPNHPTRSEWFIFSSNQNDYSRMKAKAEQLSY